MPGAGGDGGLRLSFTNRSADTCTLVGYPGAAVLNGAGQQVVQAARTPAGYLGGLPVGEDTAPVVTLAAGQDGAAELKWIENPQKGQTVCPTYTSIVVTPPNAYRSSMLRLTSSVLLCADLEIHPVLPGSQVAG